MSTIIKAGNSTTGLALTADNTGQIELKTGTGSGTTALTLDSSQNATFASAATITGNLTLTGNASGIIKSGTNVSASGTSVDFTGIPSTANRITVMFNGVSTTGTSIVLVRLVSGGTVATTGYSAGAGQQTGTNATGVLTSGFPFATSGTAASGYCGQMILSNQNGNIWAASGCSVSTTSGAIGYNGGIGTGLAGVLDQIRITTVNGTDTFDAGTINILWE